MSTITVTINGNTYVFPDDFIANRGYLEKFPAALQDVVTVAGEVQANADYVAALQAPNRLLTTSTTSTSIATGAKTFTTAANLITAIPLKAGDIVKVFSQSSPTNYMIGYVSSDPTGGAPTTLAIVVTKIQGSGTFSDWRIITTGDTGADGTLNNIGSLSQSLDSATIADDDLIAIYDASGAVTKKMTFREFMLALVPYISTYV